MNVFPIAFALLVSVVTTEALAYIPHSQTIVNRLVRNHGKGAYAVEQEVVFRTAGEPVVLRERWIIENGESMRLTVSAPKASSPVRYEAVYDDGKRTFTDPDSSALKTSNLSAEFLEGFVHARSGRGFLNSLVRARIVPQTIFKERPRIQKLDQVRYEKEPMVRLGRSSGVVTYTFGEPTPADPAKKLNPAAWIEQDTFILRRLRFPSEAEVSVDRHSVYANALKLARERTVTWADNSVLIRVLSVKSVPAGQVGKLADASSLNAKGARLPDLAQVREFYSRFR